MNDTSYSQLINSLTWDQLRYLEFITSGTERWGYPSCTAKEIRDMVSKGIITKNKELTDGFVLQHSLQQRSAKGI